jgi:hypothetical protein
MNIAECIHSHIVMLSGNFVLKYDGSHVKATKNGQHPTLHTYNNFGQVSEIAVISRQHMYCHSLGWWNVRLRVGCLLRRYTHLLSYLLT